MPETILTLTLPATHETGTLILRRGEVGHVAHFTYTSVNALSEIIAEALVALSALEEHVPVISEAPQPPPTTAPKAASRSKLNTPSLGKTPAPPTSAEPTLDIPLKKGKKAVKISHLKIAEGDTDAAAYAVAVRIASKLIDGGLWNGDSPIRLPNVYTLEKRMRSLDAADMVLYTLADFTAA